MEINRRRTWDFKLDTLLVKLISDKDSPLKINPRVIIVSNEKSKGQFITNLSELEQILKVLKEIQNDE